MRKPVRSVARGRATNATDKQCQCCHPGQGARTARVRATPHRAAQNFCTRAAATVGLALASLSRSMAL